ncbi:amidohydrolase [Clostridium sp. B9]|uniref:amidohydrolase n=1 Tax=Clostridium sp. B9 TaxID=3423224 RepID=UPI003D2F4CBE
MRNIYINGEVYTITNGMKEAFVEEDGRLIYVGNNDEALKLKDEESNIYDLEGKFVTSGFNDSHMHVLGLGYSLQMINLSNRTRSIEDVKSAIREYIDSRKLEDNQWIKGRGWNHDYFQEESRFPNRYDLDEVSKEYPICIIRACGHVCIVNSKALELLEINKYTLQIEGGTFDLDETGEPLGIFRENALNLIYDNIPSPSLNELKEMIKNSCRLLNSFGVTSAQTDDFIVFPKMSYEEVIKAYKELEEEGNLSVRIYEQAQLVDMDVLKVFIEKGYKTGVGSDLFKIGPLKLLGDGSLGARTAYLCEDYKDDNGNRGIAVYTQEQFDELIGYAHKKGMQVAVHAIGDGIMSMIIESIEKAIVEFPKENHRHGIVHCQITTEDILRKFKELNLCAYFQSIFLDYDINIVEDRIGKERAKKTYNFKRMIEDGIIACNGSDAPVELPKVLNGIQCAITRKTLDGKKGPFLKEQALTVEEAIKTYTILGAYASFEEKLKGSLEEGKVADFIILSANPFNVDKDKIKDIDIEATYLNGSCIFRNKV